VPEHIRLLVRRCLEKGTKQTCCRHEHCAVPDYRAPRSMSTPYCSAAVPLRSFRASGASPPTGNRPGPASHFRLRGH
jgi:hypothetical protein